jgi:hypothetical protein
MKRKPVILVSLLLARGLVQTVLPAERWEIRVRHNSAHPKERQHQ